MINGEGQSIEWKGVESFYTDYSVTLDSINGTLDAMTRNQSIRIYKVKFLREFALGVIVYRFNLEDTDELVQTIAK